MSILQIPIANTRGNNLAIDTFAISEKHYRKALMLGLSKMISTNTKTDKLLHAQIAYKAMLEEHIADTKSRLEELIK
jgi:uncharacterized protein YbgA (DUF1722 family)